MVCRFPYTGHIRDGLTIQPAQPGALFPPSQRLLAQGWKHNPNLENQTPLQDCKEIIEKEAPYFLV